MLYKKFVIIACMTFPIVGFAQDFEAPETKIDPVVDTVHGMLLTDPYRWLENKKDPAVVEWTHAQHDATVAYVNEKFEEISGLREELRAYIDRDIISPMTLIADRQFFTMKKKGDAQSKLYTRIGEEDILLFDPERIDTSGKSSLSGRSFTKKGDKVAIGMQSKGAEISIYYIIDTKTGKQLGEPIEGLRGFAWTDDEQHAYIWIRTQEMIDQQKPIEVHLHRLGSDRSEDTFLIKPADAKNTASVYDTRWSDITFISEGDFYATHSLKMKKTGTDDKPVEIYASREFRASPNALDDKIYFYTNHEAPNFKLMVADKAQPGFEHWKTLVPEKETVFEDYAVAPEHLLYVDKKDVLNRLHLYDLEGNYIKQVDLPEIGNVAYVSYNRDVGKIYMGITGFTTPYKIFELDPSGLEREKPAWQLFYEQESPLNMDDIVGEIKFYTSKDGTKVPLFVIHRKDVELNGNNPTILYGYGGFNVGISPSYVGSNAMFINRGGVYAIAGIRGGDEYGESWHHDGMLDKKQNCFDDFIAAAEYLVGEGYTNSDRLMIYGGSNGGLLVGAVATQRPDLFKAVYCAVPLLDMVRFHKFLIARYWIPEYGDPDVEEDFENILEYSPYHNIRMGIDHPTMMVTAGENDTRVDPLHAKKFVAALQNNPGQVNPVMLYMNFDSGHGSGKSTEQIIDEQEFRWRFMMRVLGL